MTECAQYLNLLKERFTQRSDPHSREFETGKTVVIFCNKNAALLGQLHKGDCYNEHLHTKGVKKYKTLSEDDNVSLEKLARTKDDPDESKRYDLTYIKLQDGWSVSCAFVKCE